LPEKRFGIECPSISLHVDTMHKNTLRSVIITACCLTLGMPLMASTPLEGWADDWKVDWTTQLRDSSDINPFSVSEGVLSVRGEPYGYIRTREVYHKYHLEFEWRWTSEPGNSGVLLHINGVDQVWPLCIESQLRSGNAGDIVMIRTGSGVTANGENYMVNGDRMFLAVPRSVADIEKPAGEWNHCRIESGGTTLKIFVNGALVNEATQMTLSSGFVGFQSEGAPLQIRALSLKPIP
jgi:hypothetical protein